MTLIDADRLIDEFEDTIGNSISRMRLKLQVQNQPKVDAVEVVRCKDCRFYFFVEGEDRGECDESIDRFRPFYPNDFCSYGERIDNDS